MDERAENDGFLSRWSQRKQRVRAGQTLPETPPATPPATPPDTPLVAGRDRQALTTPPAPAALSAAGTLAGAHAPAAGAERRPAVAPPLPTLDDVAQLTRDADFSRFVAADVDGGVRNAALRKLFSDPHYNIMDGLDTYIDDYNTPDPLPASMLRQMVQAQALGLFDDEAVEPTAPDTITHAAGPTAEALPSPDQTADENADLRLQPLDAAGREGPEPGAGEDGAGEH